MVFFSILIYPVLVVGWLLVPVCMYVSLWTDTADFEIVLCGTQGGRL